MSNSREISQLASFITVDDATKNIGITSGTTSFVGIGSTSPTVKLDVLGDVKISGVVTATSFTGIINSSVGIVTALSGTAVTFTTGNITTLSGSNAYYNTGIVTTLSGTNLTYTNGNVTSLTGTSATITTGNITTLSGSNAYYNTGIVTTLSGTNLTYSNSSLTSITGTSATITTGNITTLSGSNSYYNVGVITALTGTSATITSANITTLSGSNLYYNTGIVTTLSGTNINYSGISTFGSILINAGIISATSPSGIVTYYGDGSHLIGVNAFNVINQSLSSSLVYPTFANSVGVTSIGISTTQVVFVPSTGNIGIGTTNPTSRLSVVSPYNENWETRIGGHGVILAQNSTNAGDLFTPSYVIQQNYPYASFSLGYEVGAFIYADNSFSRKATVGFFKDTGTGTGIYLSPTGYAGLLGGAGDSGLTIRSSGNIGIGTTNPTSKLTVAGNVSFSGVSTISGVQISAGIITAVGVGTVVYYGDGSHLIGVNAFNVIQQNVLSSPVYPTLATNIGVSSVGISSTGLVFIPVSNSLGIGTTNPTSTLTVNGNALFTGTGIVTATTFSGTLIGYASSAGISTNLNDGLAGNVVYQSAPNTTAFLANGTSNYVLQSNGVGNAPTWVPAAPSGAVTGLVVRDSSNNIVGTSGSISQLTFSSGLSVTGATGAAGIATITLSSNIVGTSLSITGISTFTNGSVFIGTASSTGTSSQPLQVTGGAYVSGSVGIGTTNPVYKLDVLGDINSFTAVRVKGVNILDEALRLSIAFG